MNLARVSSGMKACSKCGLENGRDALVCAGCGSGLSDAGLPEADAAQPGMSDQGASLAGVSQPRELKSLRVRVLEWFLVLFALSQSRILYLPYYLYLIRGSVSWANSWDVFNWIHYLLHNLTALGILGYVLLRNSRWWRAAVPHLRGSESAMPNSEHLDTSEQDSGSLRITELLLVLSVAFGGAILNSFELLSGRTTFPDTPMISTLARDIHQMFFCAGVLALLSYVLNRSSRRFQDLGLRWTSRDVAVALPLVLGAGVANWLFRQITFPGAELLTGHQPQVPDFGNLVFGSSISMAAVLVQVVNGFFEELIVRGYLMTEVRRLSGSSLFAILCSVAVQVSYHLYQGGPMALSYVGGFMVLAGYYAKTNRILPPILAHIALDLNSLVMYAVSRF